MNVSELKAGLHSLIDRIESVQLLEEYYLEMKRMIETGTSNIWDNLSDEQKQEVLLSFEESENDENLINTDEVLKRYEQWL